MAATRRKTLRIAIATETRAEYWLLRPVYRALASRPGIEPTFLASGMHHLPQFGRTIEAIRAEPEEFRVREIRTLAAGDDDPAGQARSAARAVAGYARELADFDWLMVLGDRLEMLAAALAATALGKPIAHLHGGDVAPGVRDEAIRQAISKLAHLHFAASADAVRRLRRIGEQPWRIHLAGAPAIDAVHQTVLPGKAELDRLVGFDTADPFAVVLQHAAGFSPAREQTLLRGTLQAVGEHFARAVVIGPGLDAGSSLLHETIQEFVTRLNGRPKPTDGSPWASNRWTFFPTLDQGDYFALLSRAAVLVGNSSSGMIESAYFKLAVVDVGPRQAGRLHSGNVIHSAYGREDVLRAIARAVGDRRFRAKLARCRNLYGPGRAGQTIARTLAAVPIDRRLLVKESG